MENKVLVLNCTVNWFGCFLSLFVVSGTKNSTLSILTHYFKKKKKKQRLLRSLGLGYRNEPRRRESILLGRLLSNRAVTSL